MQHLPITEILQYPRILWPDLRYPSPKHHRIESKLRVYRCCQHFVAQRCHQAWRRKWFPMGPWFFRHDSCFRLEFGCRLRCVFKLNHYRSIDINCISPLSFLLSIILDPHISLGKYPNIHHLGNEETTFVLMVPGRATHEKLMVYWLVIEPSIRKMCSSDWIKHRFLISIATLCMLGGKSPKQWESWRPHVRNRCFFNTSLKWTSFWGGWQCRLKATLDSWKTFHNRNRT